MLVLGADAFFYIALAILYLLFWFSAARRELPGGSLAMIGGFLLVYALPYLVSFSHPTYHLPMLPIMLLPAGVWIERTLHANGRPPKLRRNAKAWAYISIAALLAIQVEFVLQMYSLI